MRESFGLGNQARPAGGKGCLKFYGIHTALSGFWIEYPSNKNTTWLTAPAKESSSALERFNSISARRLTSTSPLRRSLIAFSSLVRSSTRPEPSAPRRPGGPLGGVRA